MKRFWPSVFIFLLVFFCFSACALADLVIDAENISYEQQGRLIRASGNVVATLENFVLKTDQLTYDTFKGLITCPNDFYMQKEKVELSGQQLNYFPYKKLGDAKNVRIEFAGVNLTGKTVSVKENSIDLNAASFTTCDIKQAPHYHISASDIVIYPYSGWIVCYWGIFWMGDLPAVPVPTYIYDARAEEKDKSNIPPFPEIGSDPDYGIYIQEKIAWELSRKLYGQYIINYSENKKLGAGIDANYFINEHNDGNARFFVNPIDPWWGGITHHFNFGESIKPYCSLGESSFDFLPYSRRFELDVDLSIREKINYERVSFLPEVTVKSKRITWISPRYSWDFSTSYGKVKEESSNLSLYRTKTLAGVYYDIPVGTKSVLTPALALDYRGYSNATDWLRLQQYLTYSVLFDGTMFSLTWMHYLEQSGLGAFNFERYKYEPLDQLDSRVSLALFGSKFIVETAHYLPYMDPKDIDYTISAGLHCYAIMLTYRAMRQEFLLGFKLLTGED